MARQFGVSEATISRDISELQEWGTLIHLRE
ncbi:MAG: HTH domain-containing protein [Pyrinomonadaceae bacterium]